ncbi:TauD/TfdA family dioxygenase [Micromonospora matsumotoense]|uniref:TauD/TfdA family dioxygenase n=1 Tax=Micromonospora matsumotoense TaxID=121616 RepID=UPI003432B460
MTDFDTGPRGVAVTLLWDLHPAQARTDLASPGWLVHRFATPLRPHRLLRNVRAIGLPVAPDGARLVWPVRSSSTSGDDATFSQTSLAAGPHTDSQHSDRPEDAFVLHCVSPAACGGGSSVLIRAVDVITRLEHRDPAALALLRQVDVPFAAPGRSGCTARRGGGSSTPRAGSGGGRTPSRPVYGRPVSIDPGCDGQSRRSRMPSARWTGSS